MLEFKFRPMVQEGMSFKDLVYARTADENRDHKSSQVFALVELKRK